MAKSKYTLTALKQLASKLSFKPELFVILGSGYGAIAKEFEAKAVIPFRDIEGYYQATAPGHKGDLIYGKYSGREVVVADGRIHAYEGYSADILSYCVRIAAHLGAKKMVTTNLSGGINPFYKVGDIIVIKDHINLSGQTPLLWGYNNGKTFVDMIDAYSVRLRALLKKTADKLSIPLKEGVLAYLSGPSFETPAELRMLKIIGSDAVGWSIIPEVLEARRVGIEVCGIAIISDIIDLSAPLPVNLKEIYSTGRKAACDVKKLLDNFIPFI